MTVDIDKICWNRACLFFDQEHHGNCMPCNSTGAEPNIYLDCDHVVPINPQDSNHYIKRREEVGNYLKGLKRASTSPMKKEKRE